MELVQTMEDILALLEHTHAEPEYQYELIDNRLKLKNVSSALLILIVERNLKLLLKEKVMVFHLYISNTPQNLFTGKIMFKKFVDIISSRSFPNLWYEII